MNRSIRGARRGRFGSTMTEIVVAAGILGFGLAPILGHWVTLTGGTRGLKNRTQALRIAREYLGRCEAMGPRALLDLAGNSGMLPGLEGIRAASGRVTAADGSAPAAGETEKVRGSIRPEQDLLRLKVEVPGDSDVVLQVLLPREPAPATPEWE